MHLYAIFLVKLNDWEYILQILTFSLIDIYCLTKKEKLKKKNEWSVTVLVAKIFATHVKCEHGKCT